MQSVDVSNSNSSNATPMLSEQYSYNQWDNNYAIQNSTTSQTNHSGNNYVDQTQNGWYYGNEMAQVEQNQQQTQQNQIYQNFNYQKTDYSCLNQNQDPTYQQNSYNYHPNYSNPIQDPVNPTISQSTIKMEESYLVNPVKEESYLINPINSLNQIKMEGENFSSDLNMNGLNMNNLDTLNNLNNSLNTLSNGNNSIYGAEDLNWNYMNYGSMWKIKN